jgi:hypothetical protein
VRCDNQKHLSLRSPQGRAVPYAWPTHADPSANGKHSRMDDPEVDGEGDDKSGDLTSKRTKSEEPTTHSDVWWVRRFLEYQLGQFGLLY